MDQLDPKRHDLKSHYIACLESGCRKAHYSFPRLSLTYLHAHNGWRGKHNDQVFKFVSTHNGNCVNKGEKDE